MKKKLTLHKGVINDEFYTRKEDVENCLKYFDFSDKIVYCPADGEESEFVIYLKGKCKELIYTSDDFRTHFDLFQKADIIVTNPPFSLKKTFFEFIKKAECDYLFLGHNIIPKGWVNEITDSGMKVFWEIRRFKNRPEQVCCKWYTNLDIDHIPMKNHVEWCPKTEPDDILNIKDIDGVKRDLPYFSYEHVPEKWTGRFLVPITWDYMYKYLNLKIYTRNQPTKNGKAVFDKLIVELL